jgi:hypothetical protein
MGAALLAEYQDVLGRESIWRGARLTAVERETFLDIFLSICPWTRIYYAAKCRGDIRANADDVRGLAVPARDPRPE